MKFTEFNLETTLLNGIDAMGFEEATPIQQQAIPILIEGKDLIACAQTGTGKTAAFLLPILNKLVQKPSETTNTLVVVPTRELALQIDQMLQGFSYFTSVSSVAIYGGNDGKVFDAEKTALQNHTNIIVATPGRLLAHIKMGYVRFDNVQHLVFDEADRMLDMGFFDDIMKISSHLPKVRQTIMFSATMPPRIREMAKKLMVNPSQINIAMSKPPEGVLQAAYLVEDSQKNALIKILLENHKDMSVLIFASTKLKVKEIEKELWRAKLKIKAIHSDLEQIEREEVLRNFRSRHVKILVATDILSRGIDIEDIGLVVNYDVPGDAEDYVHRVGRTARAESTGVALTFVNKREQSKFYQIEQLIGEEVKKLPLPEEVGVSVAYEPHTKEKYKKTFSKGKKPNFKKPDFKNPDSKKSDFKKPVNKQPAVLNKRKQDAPTT